MKKFGSIAILLISALGANAAAQSDTAFVYQGSLDDAGAPASGTYSINFSLWNSLSGGAQVGSTLTNPTLSVSEGLLVAELDFGAEVFDGSARWLEIEVDGNTLSPRQPVARSPYSIQTRGLFVDIDEKVGIGTTNPGHPLHVVAPSGSLFTVFGSNSNNGGVGLYGRSSTGGGNGVRGYASSVTGVNIGVFGLTQSSDGRGVFGHANAASGNTYGVLGRSDSDSGQGIFGHASSTSGETYGVIGQNDSPDGIGVFGHGVSISGEAIGAYGRSDSVQGRGVVGAAEADSGNTFGVYGFSQSPDGRGVVGHAMSLTGQNYGVYGQTDSVAGRGIVGSADSTTGANTGVIGQTFSTGGIGVNGSAYASSGVNFGVFGNSNSPNGYDFFAAGGTGVTYGTGSSIRWKNNVINIDNPLEKLARLRGVYFDWNEAHGGTHDIGMIAEEVGKVLPEIVAYEDNGYDAHGMDYSKLTPLLVEAVNTLSTEQGARILELEQENARLQSRLVAIEAAMRALNSSSGPGDN